jgi:hypothetical protein
MIYVKLPGVNLYIRFRVKQINLGMLKCKFNDMIDVIMPRKILNQ